MVSQSCLQYQLLTSYSGLPLNERINLISEDARVGSHELTIESEFQLIQNFKVGIRMAGK